VDQEAGRPVRSVRRSTLYICRGKNADVLTSRQYAVKASEYAITKSVPSFYVRTLRDHAIPPFMQNEYAKSTVGSNCKHTLSIDSGHMPQLSHPKELSKLLQKALRVIEGEHGALDEEEE
jgi:pimeloyl-ACP methyl ester carboxylesterase